VAPGNATSLPETLRARKKRRTRQRIAAVAARLFRARGYDRVRMRDIARAADVSDQTLYNYFPTKEHLVFDLDQEFEQRLVDLVRTRGADVTIAKAVAHDARRMLAALVKSMGKPTGIPESVLLGAALRRVWVEMNARAADRLAEALRDDERERHTPAAAAIAARSIVALFAVILEQVGVAAMAGTPSRLARRELSAVIDTAAARGPFALGTRRTSHRPNGPVRRPQFADRQRVR
jgi:AcrR family transcriptional regulator